MRQHKPTNVLANLIQEGRISIAYGPSLIERTTVVLDGQTRKSDALQSIIDGMKGRRFHVFSVVIGARPARTARYTTGNPQLDGLLRGSLVEIKLTGAFFGTELQVVRHRREHLLVVPNSVATITTRPGHGRPRRELFRAARNAVISTRGEVTFGSFR